MMAGTLEGLEGQFPNSWQGYLQEIARRIRTVAQEPPNVFPLMVTQHPAAPWVRPPIRDLNLIEHLLSTLRQHGFSNQQAVEVYKSFSSLKWA